jgi:multicomponent Na+:H+ antiporter subunit C
MSSLYLYVSAAVIVLSIGIYGFFTQPHLLKKLMSLNISAAGIFLLFISFAGRGSTPDPVPHALVLTGIVISVSTTAYGIVLAAKLHRLTGCVTLDHEDSDY